MSMTFLSSSAVHLNPFCISIDPYIQVYTGTNVYVRNVYVRVRTSTYWYVQVCTGSGMYWYIRLRNYKLGHAIKFTQLQTRACKYRLVHASTYLYILAHTSLYFETIYLNRPCSSDRL